MKNDLVPLHDILKEIEFLHAIRDRTDLVGFKASPTDVRASYSIMVISEAVRRIPEAWLDAQPEIPWQAIRGIGNKLRHEYQLISDVILWGVIAKHADALKRTIEVMLAKHGGSQA
ncbi:MAG TPA: HepT-like ribonuclease domain-containing protein [Hyphomicrobiaceae bacterium]|jgi:uncharacterized protein with HEPN domain